MKLIDRIAEGSASIDKRFRFDEAGVFPFVLVQLQVHFVRESGSSAEYTAPLLVKRYARAGTRFRNELRRIERAGVDDDDSPFDINLRIPDEELRNYRLGAGDDISIEWTDPSAGVVGWGIIATLAFWNPATGRAE